MDKVKFGRKLFQARRAKHLTSNELAEKLGMSGSYIRQLECGNRKPSLDFLLNACSMLDVSPNYLLKDNMEAKLRIELEELEQKLRKLSEQDLHMISQFVDAVEQNKHDAAV